MGGDFGRYEAIRRIARGGMATVYLGRARGAGGFERLVAIKVMHEHIADEPAFKNMFLDEARLAARIHHPHVVPTLDVADDGRFIVMEYVRGASLNELLRGQRTATEEAQTLPLAMILRIILDTLDGLHAAHGLRDNDGQPLNLVHRDISPHNILVGSDGISRLTDFGIAHAEARITSTRGGELKGKIPYMAPEQLEDQPLDRRTDVYAAGCVLWEMLTGKRLISGSSEAAMACAVLAGQHASAVALRPDVPAAIDDVCRRAIASREGRWSSARAFSEALEHAADDLGLQPCRRRDLGDLVTQRFPERCSPDGLDSTVPSSKREPTSERDAQPPSAANHTVTAAPFNRAMVAHTAPDGELATDASLVSPVTEPPLKPFPGKWIAVAAAAAVAGGALWWSGSAGPSDNLQAADLQAASASNAAAADAPSASASGVATTEAATGSSGAAQADPADAGAALPSAAARILPPTYGRQPPQPGHLAPRPPQPVHLAPRPMPTKPSPAAAPTGYHPDAP